MKLAFWKRKRPRSAPSARTDAASAQPDFEAADNADDEESAARALRVRTRRRLIGAFALLLAVVVLVPMLLDPAPRVVPDNIPIDLPSDKTPFAPKLAPPPADAGTAAAPGVAVPAAPGSAADAAAVAADAPAAGAPASGAGASKPAKPAEDHPADRHKKHADNAEPAAPDSRHKAHAADAPAPAKGRIFVQVAALANESKAQELASRLLKSGLAPFVERTETGEGIRYRVRLGPFATRGEAERSRARLHALGVNGNIVGA